MADGYSRSPKLLKGAIVQFTETPIVPIPNIIVFQYNPESLQRTLSPYVPPAPAEPPPTEVAATTAPGQAVLPPAYLGYDPTETFNLTLLLDASDALEEPERHPVAVVTGVADRIAALETLLYPTGDNLLGSLIGSANVSISISGSGGGISAGLKKAVERKEVPVTLFIWGPGRIVPVRLTSFVVEEQQWNQLLYPVRAKVTIGMRVVTSAALAADQASSTSGKGLAKFCYDFTRVQREALALANIANTAESILGILPF